MQNFGCLSLKWWFSLSWWGWVLIIRSICKKLKDGVVIEQNSDLLCWQGFHRAQCQLKKSCNSWLFKKEKEAGDNGSLFPYWNFEIFSILLFPRHSLTLVVPCQPMFSGWHTSGSNVSLPAWFPLLSFVTKSLTMNQLPFQMSSASDLELSHILGCLREASKTF